MGVVLVARHEHLRERVAIKCLLPELAHDTELVARFLQEARAARRIRGEHVVRIDDVDTSDSGAPFIVMELLEGQNLEELIESGGPLPVATVVDFIGQALEAIGEAHSLGMVHRDLKPANLFLVLRPDGSPCIKVLDFGITKVPPSASDDRNAALTQQTAVLGSPNYMAPEQIVSTRDVDARADVWAVGVIVQELATGELPFDSASVPTLFARIMNEAPAPITHAGVPAGLKLVVGRCLEKDPARRYADVAELALALAPYGSSAARTSAERVAKVLYPASRVSSGDALSGRASNELFVHDTVLDRPHLAKPLNAPALVMAAVAILLFFILVGVVGWSAGNSASDAVAPAASSPPAASSLGAPWHRRSDARTTLPGGSATASSSPAQPASAKGPPQAGDDDPPSSVHQFFNKIGRGIQQTVNKVGQ